MQVRNFLTYGEGPGGAYHSFEFDGAVLWSVAGANGVGKSALFDAITWTLFGEHRGGRSEDHRLVRQGAVHGEAAFEFRLGGACYRVERSVSARSKTTKRQASMLDERTGRWMPIPGTDGARGLDQWVQQLGLRYKTFIASTVLLQGKSDQLIVAAPKDRFEVLAGALDLRAYEAIGKRAHERAAHDATALAEAEAQLAQIEPVTQSEVDAAHASHVAASDAVGAAQREFDDASLTLADALRAERLRRDLADALARVSALATALDEAETIEREHAEWRELRAIMPVLDHAVERHALAQQRELEASSLEAQARDLDVPALAARARASAAEVTAVAALLTSQRDAHLDSARLLDSASQELAEVARDEALESLLQATRDELAALANDETRAPSQRVELVVAERTRDALPLAQALIDAQRALSERDARCHEVGDSATIEDERAAANAAMSGAEGARNEAAAYLEEGRVAEAKATAAARSAEERLVARTAAGAEARCLRCGQAVSAEHIERELTEARAALATATEVARRTADLTRDAAAGVDAAEEQLTDARAAISALAVRAAGAKSAEHERTVARAVRDRARSAIDQADPSIAGVATELVGLATPQRHARLRLLEQLPALAAEAQRLRAVETRAATLREQLKALEAGLAPHGALLSAHERAARRAVHKQRRAAHDQLEAELRAREEEVQRAAHTQDEDASAERHASANAATLIERARALHADGLSARGQADGALAAVSDAVRQRYASSGVTYRDERRDRLRDLADAEKRYAQLQTARAEHDQAIARRDTLQGELDGIPSERREPAATWEQRRSEARAHRDDATTAAAVAAQRLDALRAAVATYADRRATLATVERRARLSRRLADLLGRNRLMARLVQQALHDLERLANEMLTQTSAGRLEVRLMLKASAGDEDIEIQGLDHVSAGGPMEVVFMSGGQKFRVAVALAAAIGQYMGAPHAGRSLIVDEGFGSLDEPGRREMIAALREIAPFMDRVIVVSHHEDFSSRELFPSGFLIEKLGATTNVRRVV